MSPGQKVLHDLFGLWPGSSGHINTNNPLLDTVFLGGSLGSRARESQTKRMNHKKPSIACQTFFTHVMWEGACSTGFLGFILSCVSISYSYWSRARRRNHTWNTCHTDTNFLSNATGNGDRKCIWQKDSVCVTGIFLSVFRARARIMIPCPHL